MERPTDRDPEPGLIEGDASVVLFEDGYIRLTVATFSRIALLHLVSGVDDDSSLAVFSVDARPGSISGYTEWLSSTTPTITLGWDWVLEGAGDEVHCVRACQLRGNVMLVDERGQDLGFETSAVLLGRRIDALAWGVEVLKAVQNKFGNTCQP